MLSGIDRVSNGVVSRSKKEVMPPMITIGNKSCLTLLKCRLYTIRIQYENVMMKVVENCNESGMIHKLKTNEQKRNVPRRYLSPYLYKV